MRKAAGILMILYGVKTIGFFVGFRSETGWVFPDEFLADFLIGVIIAAVFIITGGVFCLKRKYWKLCFTSSLLLCPFMFFDLYYLPPYSSWFKVLSPLIGIPPIIFVCLRKREWSESQA
jgi:hypothetical protein